MKILINVDSLFLFIAEMADCGSAVEHELFVGEFCIAQASILVDKIDVLAEKSLFSHHFGSTMIMESKFNRLGALIHNFKRNTMAIVKVTRFGVRRGPVTSLHGQLISAHDFATSLL